MLKELIATCLFSFNLGVPRNVDKGIENTFEYENITVTRNANNWNKIYGAYCFRDTFIQTYTPQQVDEYMNFYTDNLDLSNESLAHFLLYENVGNTSSYTYVEMREFYIDSFDADFFRIYLRYSDGSISFDVDLRDSPTLIDLEAIYDNGQAPNLILWFPVAFYVNDLYYSVFNMFFTPSGNAYNYYYSGYYTFFNLATNFNNTWSYYGFTAVDGNLYNSVHRSYNWCYASGFGGTFDIFSNGNFSYTSRYILINGTLINNEMFARMSTDGVFAYVRDGSYDNVTFYDLMFSIVDAPVHFITSLFSFDLLGVQFYVAFMGLLTVLIIAFVIRKVI